MESSTFMVYDLVTVGHELRGKDKDFAVGS